MLYLQPPLINGFAYQQTRSSILPFSEFLLCLACIMHPPSQLSQHRRNTAANQPVSTRWVAAAS
jgi:hypothetical protein